MDRAQTANYDDLPRSYHFFKWRILLAFTGFYLFLYLGRFNFWPVAPLGDARRGPHHGLQRHNQLRNVGHHHGHPLGNRRIRERRLLGSGHQHDLPVVAST